MLKYYAHFHHAHLPYFCFDYNPVNVFAGHTQKFQTIHKTIMGENIYVFTHVLMQLLKRIYKISFRLWFDFKSHTSLAAAHDTNESTLPWPE